MATQKKQSSSASLDAALIKGEYASAKSGSYTTTNLGLAKTFQSKNLLAAAQSQKAANDNVTHTEMFVDPQAHLDREISLSNVFIGMQKAIKQAEKDFGIKASIIVCFLRHLSEKNALNKLWIIVGIL